MHLTVLHRVCPTTDMEYTFFEEAYVNFSKTCHILDHKSSLTIKKNQNNVLYDHSEVKVEIKSKETTQISGDWRNRGGGILSS